MYVNRKLNNGGGDSVPPVPVKNVWTFIVGRNQNVYAQYTMLIDRYFLFFSTLMLFKFYMIFFRFIFVKLITENYINYIYNVFVLFLKEKKNVVTCMLYKLIKGENTSETKKEIKPATCGSGTVYLFGAPEFTPVFSGFCVTQSLAFLVMFCRSLFVPLFLWPLSLG